MKPTILAVCLFGWLTQPVIAEDDYLSLISSEAQKVDQTQSPPSSSEADANAPMDDTQIKTFEATLKEQFKGSYFVYTRLDASAKEGLYQDYASGASFEEIRKKIFALYSNKR